LSAQRFINFGHYFHIFTGHLWNR